MLWIFPFGQPGHVGLLYKTILSTCFYEVSKVLLNRYKYLKELLVTILQDNTDKYHGFEFKIQQIKVYFTLLYSSVECLEKLFGMAILTIFINNKTLFKLMSMCGLF